MNGQTSVPLNSRQQHVTQQTQVEHDALLTAMRHLESALESPAPGREQQWHRRVVENLRAVVERLTEHVHSADGPDGLMAVIDETRPTLVHRVERLRREHSDLVQQARALQAQVEHYGEDEPLNYADIRQRATWLLNALRHHRAAEIDLVFETFYVDLGVGD